MIKLGANLEARSRNDMTPLLTAVSRNKPELVYLLLKKGAKLDLSTKNELGKHKVDNMSAEMKLAINKVQTFKRIMPFLKHHKHRRDSETYPEEFKGLNKNILTKIISEYM